MPYPRAIVKLHRQTMGRLSLVSDPQRRLEVYSRRGGPLFPELPAGGRDVVPSASADEGRNALFPEDGLEGEDPGLGRAPEGQVRRLVDPPE